MIRRLLSFIRPKPTASEAARILASAKRSKRTAYVLNHCAQIRASKSREGTHAR